MHHRGGAFNETIYIYEPVIQKTWNVVEKPRYVSLGLGLGYNEFLVAREALKSGRGFYLVSFEADPFLRENFLQFLKGESSELEELYRKICFYFQLDPAEVGKLLMSAADCGDWELKGALTEARELPDSIHGYFWDAFSAKTSPELWEEDFLLACLNKAGDPAVFATYASRGPLKRALQRVGFQVETRPGFQGKRNSTLAIKSGSLYPSPFPSELDRP